MTRHSSGIREGRFTPCPGSPNCVSSQAPADDKTHYIKPFHYSGNKSGAHRNIMLILKNSARVTILTNSPDYIHAVFQTKIMRFTDDVEFYFPDDRNIIHIRSASRVGHSDLGTNRKRMEELRALFSPMH